MLLLAVQLLYWR